MRARRWDPASGLLWLSTPPSSEEGQPGALGETRRPALPSLPGGAAPWGEGARLTGRGSNIRPPRVPSAQHTADPRAWRHLHRKTHGGPGLLPPGYRAGAEQEAPTRLDVRRPGQTHLAQGGWATAGSLGVRGHGAGPGQLRFGCSTGFPPHLKPGRPSPQATLLSGQRVPTQISSAQGPGPSGRPAHLRASPPHLRPQTCLLAPKRSRPSGEIGSWG